MSDQNTSEQPIITSGVKEKDPKRVAAGKRLGAISKQRKEEKRKALLLEQQAESNKYALCFVGGLVVVGAVSCLYLNKDKLMQMLTSDKKKIPTIPEEPSTPPPKRKSKRIFGE